LRYLAASIAAVLVVTGLLALGGTEGAPPKPETPIEPEGRIGPWVEEAGPELKAKLAEAERAASEERWADAALTWQEILDTAPARLVNVRPDLPNTFADVREVVRIRLSTLPGAGLTAYRRAADPAARKLFTRALRLRSQPLLMDVWRRFAVSSFGGRALLVLADEALRRGEVDTAIARLETLTYYDPDGKTPGIDAAGVLLRRAYCRALRGETAALAALCESAKSRADEEVAFGGRTVTLERALREISAGATKRHDPRTWATPGGCPARNRRAQTTYGKLELVGRIFAAEREGRPEAMTRPLLTTREAVVAGGRIYVKDRDQILRMDLDSGDALPPLTDLDKLSSDEFDSLLDDQRIHPATIGGDRLYAAHESGPSHSEVSLTSLLLGIDLARDGLQLWLRGGGRERGNNLTGEAGPPRNPWDDPFYADVCFTGSPALWGSRLLVSGAVIDRKIGAHLFCLDARPGARGRTIWKRLIGYGTALVKAGPSDVTRTDPGSPAISDGVVYLSTNLGAVAAVDALTGEILWLHRYPRAGSRRVMGDVTDSASGWRTDFPIVADGAVFFTPSDSDRLLIYAKRLDRATGQILRSDRIRRRFPGGEIVYEDLVGVANGVLYLTGRAEPLDEGVPVQARKAWPTDSNDKREDVWVGDPPEGRVSGRGFLTQTHCIVPTRKGIYAFPLAGNGDYETVVLDEELDLAEDEDGRACRVFGNLTPAGDGIVSVTPDGVFLFKPVRSDGSSPSGRRR
jgi:outer membrane protein assembly factor BamB